ncbi:MAG: SMC-Scp complex subunit ScpB [Thermoplasmata archaeon]|nr:SMC-Scp complex subunit ScpB [Thermoplasmata archaeon]MCI4357047.1 SMC-Scp complex subunit ScpB [Thermoplasmata archaeon]
MPAKTDALELRVEAVLFAAGRPLSVKELTEALGVDDFRRVQTALRKLIRTFDARQTALEVRHVGDRYALQLRPEFVPSARSVTPVEIAPRTLKALTLIAYHQPILQSLLAKMLGEAAYEEVERLRTLGLIRTEPKGSTLEIWTTKAFAEYFGIASTKPEEIRAFLETKLGVNAATLAAPTPSETSDVSSGPGASGSAGDAVPTAAGPA